MKRKTASENGTLISSPFPYSGPLFPLISSIRSKPLCTIGISTYISNEIINWFIPMLHIPSGRSHRSFLPLHPCLPKTLLYILSIANHVLRHPPSVTQEGESGFNHSATLNLFSRSRLPQPSGRPSLLYSRILISGGARPKARAGSERSPFEAVQLVCGRNSNLQGLFKCRRNLGMWYRSAVTKIIRT